MKIQADDEHVNLQSERDQVRWERTVPPKQEQQVWLIVESDLQLTQRLKTAKRQMDEAEGEIERLEHAKKKLQRDLDEQIEANEQLQDHLSSLRNEMR